MRSTVYSKEEVKEARDGLRLLKNKMEHQKRGGQMERQETNRDEMIGFGSNNGISNELDFPNRRSLYAAGGG